MPVNNPRAAGTTTSTSQTPSTPSAAPKPAVVPSPVSTTVTSSQSTPTPTPAAKVNSPVPSTSHVNSTNVSSGIPPPTVVVPVTSGAVPQVKVSTPSSSVNNSGSNGVVQAAELTKGVGANNTTTHRSTISAGNPSSSSSSSTGTTVAIVLSCVAIFIGALVAFKLVTSYCRKRRGVHRLRDTFIVIPTTPLESHPKNQANGGVGASPAAAIFNSNPSSSYGSPGPNHNYPRSINSRSYSNEHHLHSPHHNRHDSHLSMAEFVHSNHHNLAGYKTWDGSRPSPSPALVWM